MKAKKDFNKNILAIIIAVISLLCGATVFGESKGDLSVLVPEVNSSTETTDEETEEVVPENPTDNPTEEEPTDEPTDEPTEPVEPVEPIEPEQPEQPEEPSEPTEPVEPVEPIEPEEPQEPVVPQETVSDPLSFTEGEHTVENLKIEATAENADAVYAGGEGTIVTIESGYYDGGDNGSTTAVYARDGAKVVTRKTFLCSSSSSVVMPKASASGQIAERSG